MSKANHNIFKCIACGSGGNYLYADLEDRLFSAEGRWSLIECVNCGLVWIHPLPEQGKIDGLYDDYYTHRKGKTESRLRETVKNLILATSKWTMGYSDASRSIPGKICGRILWMIGPLREAVYSSIMWLPAERRGNLLDVGCGSGLFLNNMQCLGWNAHGVELDKKASGMARDVFKLKNICTGPLDEADFRDQSFDAVTMAHVIEHMPEPEESLRKCYRLLRPGGLMVITSPNSAGLGRRRFGALWRGWEPPRHIFIYNLDSISRIISSCGFKIRKAVTPAAVTFPVWLESLQLRAGAFSSGKESATISLMMKAESLFFWAWEYLLTRLGSHCGEELLIIAERPRDEVEN